jgi:molybdate transport system ATP-binding protein
MSALRLDAEVERDGFRLLLTLETDGGVLVLFGPSGAGKSTTLQAIAGLVSPTAGEITLDGDTLFRRAREGPDVNIPARRRRVGYVFQDYALFPHLTALGNVAYPLWRQPGAEERAGRLLERLGLVALTHRYPHELSGGQQQRVAIARALAVEPRVLLLDEPFAALDLEARRQVRGEVRRVLHDLGIPVVLVTHDREEALALGDRLAVLDEGRVIAQGEPLALLGHPPKERVARLMGVENILHLKVTKILPEEGVMICGVGEILLEVPFANARLGQEVTVGLRADDVLLASARPAGLSARNVLPGRVASVQRQGSLYEVRVDCGVPLISNVTRRALQELGLALGAEAWVVVKAASCFILQE